MLTDTHAHLDFPDFASELPAVLARAEAAGVNRILTISTTLESSGRTRALADLHAHVFATVGVHPSNAGDAPVDVITPLRALAQHPRVVAIGECGLDYHRLPSSRLHESAVATVALGNETTIDVDAAVLDGAEKSKQAIIFQEQLDLAVELGLPVIIHERDAWDDTLALLEPYTGKVRAVFHCFGKSLDHAQQVLALGHLVSFTGIVTFKNRRPCRTPPRACPRARSWSRPTARFSRPRRIAGNAASPRTRARSRPRSRNSAD